ncbi:serine/threonine-protein kinase MARK2-like [Myotis daubentonii]|uniref:serine/threonine-protein kinase MARK2-like n=1 Tax=Myotis daubentonii TaxID=98922 RepID=UPI002873B87B|nr:serine/threonine-protein kinase MARK2-like [Myotis daubentonii]
MSSDWATSSSEVSTPPVNQLRFLGDYVLQRTISKGAGAMVSLARHVPTTTEVVIKGISRKGCPEFPQEAHCLQTLNHPNITSLFEVIATQDKVYLVMEHVRGGDLGEYLETYGRMTEQEARAAFRQLVSALQYCHHRGIAHRDLKPANILLETNGLMKLADFGFAKETKGQNLSTFCGTIYYMAPEIFKHQDYDGCKADIWSLGVTLYKTVTGKLPFKGANIVRQREKILAGKFEVPHFLSRKGQSFLKRLITVDPNQRPTMEEVMEDPWLNMGQEEEPLRPYIEPPQEDLDPRVTEMMLDLGFNQEEIEHSVKQRTFNKVMGTYRILRETQTKMPSRTIRVRPYPSLEARRIFSSQEVGESFEGKTEQPSNPIDSPGSKVTTPPPNLVETISTTPPADPIEFMTATPSPVLQRGSEGSPAMRNSRSSSIISSRGAPGGAAHDLGLHTGQAEEESNDLDYPGSNVTTPPGSLVETIPTTPPADPPEFRTATPSPVLKRGRRGSPTMRNKSHRSNISRAVQEKVTPRSPQALQEKAIQLSADAVQEKGTQNSSGAVQEKAIQRSPDAVQEMATQWSPDAVREAMTQRSPSLFGRQ